MKPNTNFTQQITDTLSFDMIFVQGGSFLMGSDVEEADDDEKPVHKVSVPDFYITKYPVTQGLWEAVMENNPSNFKGANRPVEKVSWQDTQEFIKKLNVKTGRTYRLLTESEWEYAARGGQKSQGYTYAGSNKLKQVGWYNENSYGETKPVGLKYPNELGLYDMSGNVWEWVEDHWHNNYEDAPKDGSAWLVADVGPIRLLRGGSWSVNTQLCRATIRSSVSPSFRDDYVGFRVGASLSSGEPA